MLQLPPGRPEDEVTSREELVAFIAQLRDDFVERGEQWENATLDRFLDALTAWIDSSPSWYRNFDQEMPANGDWTLFARALSAAVVYE
ncbi:hypothetical protein ABZX99_06995 [Streptomyces antibioticus]|uniref:DUF7660 domain-containing protein n=1 Tax=Streptomyces phaeofaciens TaxID=68254 RepID=A0A918HRP1_9ACTN|nr:hypothetical protein [Streptomyces phaeofaciens]GGU00431.1 hypothetical protein GCM10010226_91650 [Streptomyces phaeofaciens]